MIVVAGGSGTRMGAHIPKQFLELNGTPILMHTLQQLHAIDKNMQLILVLPRNQFDTWTQLREAHHFSIPHLLASGGSTRFLSVQNGLAHVAETDLVGIHDGVRPFISKAMVDRCFHAAQTHGAAIPTVPIIQSLRKVENNQSTAVNRNQYKAVQTPQCFQNHIIQTAFQHANDIDFSDDASVVEANGTPITLVEGETENIKITSPLDLKLAELIIAGRSKSN